MKIYCEHGAITKRLKQLQRAGSIELIHFPYDPNSRSRHLSDSASPSKAQWRDMNISWNKANFSWDELKGSEYFETIKQIIGPQNRRDALHVDSAFKSGCEVFVTADQDILSKREQLQTLLDIRFFHPKHNASELDEYVTGTDTTA